jgi:ankyrin repeat protein
MKINQYKTRCEFFLLTVFIFLINTIVASAQQKFAGDNAATIQLFQTIRNGGTKKLESLLSKGADANAVSGDYSVLMAATLNGNIDAMKALIKHGANVNYYNKDSISSIWLAVPDFNKTSLLIKHGADVNWRSREGNNVLVKLAAIPGSAKLMQLLIDKGCDVHKSGRLNDIMFNAASTDDTAMVGLLIRNNVSVNDTNVIGDYPISFATNYRSFNTLKMLVDNGANVNVSPKTGILPLFGSVTPLMWTAVSNDKPSFYYLLEHGADATAKTYRGYTTLMFLAMSEADDPEMTQALIDHGASPTAKAKDKTDALYYANLKGNTKSVELLKKYISK